MIFDDAQPAIPASLVGTGRLLWVGPLTVLTSIAAASAVRPLETVA